MEERKRKVKRKRRDTFSMMMGVVTLIQINWTPVREEIYLIVLLMASRKTNIAFVMNMHWQLKEKKDNDRLWREMECIGEKTLTITKVEKNNWIIFSEFQRSQYSIETCIKIKSMNEMIFREAWCCVIHKREKLTSSCIGHEKHILRIGSWREETIFHKNYFWKLHFKSNLKTTSERMKKETNKLSQFMDRVHLERKQFRDHEVNQWCFLWLKNWKL